MPKQAKHFFDINFELRLLLKQREGQFLPELELI